MKKSLIFVLAIALFISGCSSVSLFYRNAEWYLQYKINGYTSFNTRQKELIRQDVSGYMHWHRKNALPQYIIFLQNLNGSIQYEGRLSAETVARLRDRLTSLYRETLEPAISPTAKILSMLDSRQIQELDSNLAEEIRKQKHEELDISHDEYLDKRADKTISFLEWLAGKLGAEQEHRIREMSRHLPVVIDIYILNREANQNRLIALLKDHAGEDHANEKKIAAFLYSWLLTSEASRTAQQQRVIQSFELASDEMIMQIQGMLTVTQKEHIHKMISSYIDDMHAEIAGSGMEPSQ